MRKNIGNLFLKRKASKLNRRIQVNNLGSAKTVGILYDATNPRNDEEIKEFMDALKNENLKLESIALFLSKNTAKMPMATAKNFYIGIKELSFFRIPYTNDAKKFMDEEYDILIDCNFEKHFSLQYLSSLSRAHFKVGPSGGYHQNVCDLTIALKEPIKMKDFLEQTTHYLKIINQQ